MTGIIINRESTVALFAASCIIVLLPVTLALVACAVKGLLHRRPQLLRFDAWYMAVILIFLGPAAEFRALSSMEPYTGPSPLRLTLACSAAVLAIALFCFAWHRFPKGRIIIGLPSTAFDAYFARALERLGYEQHIEIQKASFFSSRRAHTISPAHAVIKSGVIKDSGWVEIWTSRNNEELLYEITAELRAAARRDKAVSSKTFFAGLLAESLLPILAASGITLLLL